MAANTEYPERLEVTGSDAQHDGVYKITSQRERGKPVWEKVGRHDIYKIKVDGDETWCIVADSVLPSQRECFGDTFYWTNVDGDDISACNGNWMKANDDWHPSLEITAIQHREPTPPREPSIIAVDDLDEKEEMELSELGEELAELTKNFEDSIRVHNQSGHQLGNTRALLNGFIRKYNGINGGHGEQVPLVASMLDSTGLSQALHQVREEDETECRRIAEHRDQLEEKSKCKICFAQECSIIFLPCRHFAACGACSGRMNRCPMCRKNIETRYQVIIS